MPVDESFSRCSTVPGRIRYNVLENVTKFQSTRCNSSMFNSNKAVAGNPKTLGAIQAPATVREVPIDRKTVTIATKMIFTDLCRLPLNCHPLYGTFKNQLLITVLRYLRIDFALTVKYVIILAKIKGIIGRGYHALLSDPTISISPVLSAEHVCVSFSFLIFKASLYTCYSGSRNIENRFEWNTRFFCLSFLHFDDTRTNVSFFILSNPRQSN